MLKPFDSMDDYSFMMPMVQEFEDKQAESLGVFLNALLKPTSVLDVGCASGIYLLPYLQAGAQVLGIDGCLAGGKLLPEGCFTRVDLREPYSPPACHDLCLCIEVAEHLHAQYADVLVNTLTSCSDAIFFTAASPGQGGWCHHNEQPLSYWIDKFFSKGYTIHPMSPTIKSFLCSDESCQQTSWLSRNTEVFCKT